MTRPSASRGTRDIKEKEAQAFSAMEAAARIIFARYGYEEIRTPVFENAELFRRAVGETTDIVEKEMFAFEDRGGRHLALRPEGTAGVVRAYLEHGWDQSSPVKKVFYMGPMFRAERPQAGRFREFWQIGAEYFGNPTPQADAETLLLLGDFLKAAGFSLQDLTFHVNSLGCGECRPSHRKALREYLQKKQSELSDDSRARLEKNPLRVLDSKADGPKLSDAPVTGDFLCAACREHRDAFRAVLSLEKFNVVEAPRLVRGLDYYSRTVFEITAPGLGAQDAIGAGGRYDGLVESLGGPEIPAVGFALGLDRLVMALKAPETPGMGLPRVFVVVGAGALSAAWSLVQRLRRNDAPLLAAEIGAAGKSFKAQMRAADGWGANWALIVGEDEVQRQVVQLKDLKTSKQTEIPLAEAVCVVCEKVSTDARGRV